MTPERWQQITAVFHAALERDAASRTEFVRAACADDEALRDQVDALLAAHRNAGAFGDTPVVDQIDDESNAGDHVDLTPGTLFGTYRIERLLGRGGMGAVFLATDTTLHRQVALKLIDDATADDAARARVLREARHAAALNHPNIVTVYEVADANGTPFIAMEYVEGRTLREHLAGGPIPMSDVVRYGIQIADALAYAHEQGVIHRDLKAANVVATPSGRVKIVDFGLARRADTAALIHDAATTTSRTLSTGVIAGTPYVMAPEQIRGAATDHRTDIWAFGVLLYELVSGASPFSGSTTAALFSAIVVESPPPLSTGVPAPLQAIILTCLEKDPAARWQRTAAVRSALQAIQIGTHTPDWRTRLRQYGAVATLSAAAIVVALSGGNVGDVFRSRAVEAAPLTVAVLPFENVSGDREQEYFSEGVTERLIADLSRTRRLRVIAASSVRRYRGNPAPLTDIARQLSANAIVQGSALRNGSTVRLTVQLADAGSATPMWKEKYERDLVDIHRLTSSVAHTIARRLNATTEAAQPDSTVRQVNPGVYEAYLRGMFHLSREAPEDHGQALSYLHEAVQADPADPLAYVGLAEGYVTIAHGPSPPAEALPRARAAAERALALDPTLAEAIGALADVALYYEWNWGKAERLFKEALQRNPSLAMTRYHYAWYLALFNRLDEAIEEHKRARDLDPLRALHTAWLGGLYNHAGRFDEAIAEARKGLELSAGFGPSYYVLFHAYRGKGMKEEALNTIKARVKPSARWAGPALLAAAYANAGRRDEALAILAKADEKNFWELTQAYVALGDTDAAMRTLEAAHRDRRPILPWIRIRGGEFDALRSDARFRDLLRRMNLPL